MGEKLSTADKLSELERKWESIELHRNISERNSMIINEQVEELK